MPTAAAIITTTTTTATMHRNYDWTTLIKYPVKHSNEKLIRLRVTLYLTVSVCGSSSRSGSRGLPSSTRILPFFIFLHILSYDDVDN